jgi:hypothetical protein
MKLGLASKHGGLKVYEDVSRSFRTESITKYTLTTIKTRSEVTKRSCVGKTHWTGSQNSDRTAPSGRELPFAVLSQGGQSGNFWLHSRKFVTRHQNAQKNHNLIKDNKVFECVPKFKYFGTRATNQSSIPEKIKSKLYSGIPCYCSVRNLLPSCLLYKNQTIILPVVLYGYGT